MDRIQRMLTGMGGGQGGPPGDTPQVDTAEQIYISSLALLKMLKHGEGHQRIRHMRAAAAALLAYCRHSVVCMHRLDCWTLAGSPAVVCNMQHFNTTCLLGAAHGYQCYQEPP
jgi:hypothetical protein